MASVALVVAFTAGGVFIRPSLPTLSMPSLSIPAFALPERAAAEPDPWSFARSAIEELNETAIQACAADAALRASTSPTEEGRWRTQKADLEMKHASLASDYEHRVSDRVAAGNVRPSQVPPAAPPLISLTGVSCLQVVTLPPPPPAAPPVLATPSSPGVLRLSMEDLDAFARAAGWPDQPGWWPEMKRIIGCESGYNVYSHNASDPNGGSYGLTQLNGRQHFDKAGEDFEKRYDPVVNLRTALWLRTVRGHFGGGGGWSCADKLGIA